MAKIITPISLDVMERNRVRAMVAKQYDKDSRFLKIQMTEKGKPIKVEQSSVVTINAKRADNESKAFAGEANADGTVTVPITYWMLEIADTVMCDVSVVDAQSRKLSTLNFIIEVEHSNYNGDDISEDENYDLLVTLLGEVSEIMEAESKRVVQETGDSETAVMSQKSVTAEFDAISETIHGINLFDVSKIERYTRFDDSGNIITDNTAITACITDFIPVRSGESLNFTYDDGSGRAWLIARRVLCFNENKEFVSLLASYAGFCNIIGEGIAYVRMQFTTDSAENKGQISYGGTKSEYYEPYISKRVTSKNGIFSIGRFDFSFDAVKYFSDLTIVGDYILGFTESSDVGTMDGRICVYRINESSKVGVFTSNEILHNFGHCNTIDYCAGNDCLVFGNGSGEYGVEGKFYVIPNAKKLTERAENDVNSLGIEYDCTGYGFGDKLNVCWGYDNDGRNDIVIFITNDNKNIRFAQLGKGANNLGLGTMTSGKGVDEFNGTFKVIAEYTLDDGTTHPNNINCNQGSDYHNGKLYVAIGHEPHRYWEISFMPNGKTSFTEVHEPIYSASGVGATGATEGICLTDDYIIYHLSISVGEVWSDKIFVKKR